MNVPNGSIVATVQLSDASNDGRTKTTTKAAVGVHQIGDKECLSVAGVAVEDTLCVDEEMARTAKLAADKACVINKTYGMCVE